MRQLPHLPVCSYGPAFYFPAHAFCIISESRSLCDEQSSRKLLKQTISMCFKARGRPTSLKRVKRIRLISGPISGSLLKKFGPPKVPYLGFCAFQVTFFSFAGSMAIKTRFLPALVP